MKGKITYRKGIFVKIKQEKNSITIPASVLSLKGLDQINLQVLLWISSDPTLYNKPMQLSRILNCSGVKIEEAIRFWEENGVIEPGTSDKKELTFTEFVKYAQKQIGRILTGTELSNLKVLFKSFESPEASLEFFNHCLRVNITNSLQMLKESKKYISAGIITVTELRAEFERSEPLSDFEEAIKGLFGIKLRSLSERERGFIREWLAYGYGMDMIIQAHDIMNKTIGRSHIPYAHAILKCWHDKGVKTVFDAVNISRSPVQSAPINQPKQNSSFDVNEAFLANVRQTFGDIDEDFF